MRVGISPNELQERGLWDEFCRLRGWSVWCVKEGLCSGDAEITLSRDEMKALGLVVIVREWAGDDD